MPLDLTQQQELLHVLHAKTGSFVLHEELQKDINVDQELIIMETSDVKLANLDFTALMEKQQQKLLVILQSDFDSTLLEEQVLVQFAQQRQNVLRPLITHVLKVGTSRLRLKLANHAQLLIIVLIQIKLLVLLENSLTLNLLSSAWTVLLIITVLQLHKYFLVLRINGLLPDLQLANLVMLGIHVNREALKFHVLGMNGTQSMIEFALNALLDLPVLIKTLQLLVQQEHIQTLEIFIVEVVHWVTIVPIL